MPRQLGRSRRTLDQQLAMSTVRLLSASIFLLTGLLSLSTTSAGAEDRCQDADGAHWFTGENIGDSSTMVYGAKADVDFTNPALCSYTQQSSLDRQRGTLWWAMVEGNAANGQEYAQSGFYKPGGYTSPVIFSEYNDGTKSDTYTPGPSHWRRQEFTTTPALVQGNLYNFSTALNANSTAMNIFFGGSLLDTTPFNPNSAWGSPWRAEYACETWDGGDDCPGSSDTPARFRNVLVSDNHNSAYHAPTSMSRFVDKPLYYGVSETTGGFNIFTSRQVTVYPNCIGCVI